MLLLNQEPKPIKIFQKMERSGKIIVKDSDYKTIDIVKAIFSPEDNIPVIRYDPSESRKHFWQNVFGLEPLPATIPNAAELFAGSLSQDLDITPADIQVAIDKADED